MSCIIPSKRCALDFGYLHRRATVGMIARDALWISDTCIGVQQISWKILMCVRKSHPTPFPRHLHTRIPGSAFPPPSSLMVDPLVPPRSNILAHSFLLILKRYCHGCDGFGVTKSRTPPPQQVLTRMCACLEWVRATFSHLTSVTPTWPILHPLVLLLTPYFTFKPYLRWSTHFMHMKGVGIGTSSHKHIKDLS